MSMLSALPPGTVPQWATFAALLTIIMGAVTVYIRGIPARMLARNDGDKIKIDEAEKIRTDYSEQIKEFRLEVHGYRNELHVVSARLATSEATSMRRGDKLSMMAFVVRLVLDELRRLNPHNQVIEQAETLLDQLERPDPPLSGKSPALGAAEHTVDAAKEAVREVRATEAKQ